MKYALILAATLFGSNAIGFASDVSDGSIDFPFEYLVLPIIIPLRAPAPKEKKKEDE